jgi:glucose-1-phosphate thymidylyltransferase
MKGVLLCAGFGTRMHPLTENTAKPLLPVAGRPILDHLLDHLRPWLDGFVVVSNRRFFAHFAAWAPADCTVLDDGAERNETRLGGVGDLALAIAHTGTREPLLVASGDNLYRGSLASLFEAHAREPRNLVLVHDEHDLARLRRTGVPELAADGRLLALHEKPHDPPSQLACPLLYILQPNALELVGRYLRETGDADSLGGLIGWLCTRTAIWAHRLDGARLDVGDKASYAAAAEWLGRA